MNRDNRSRPVNSRRAQSRQTNTTIDIGKQAEQWACDYLQQQGMRLIQRNYHCGLGEIDLIMEHDDTLVFVEVRYRYQDRYGSAEESITPTKRRKLIATARHFLLYHPDFHACPCRFDVVCMGPGADPTTIRGSLRWLPDAFQAD